MQMFIQCDENIRVYMVLTKKIQMTGMEGESGAYVYVCLENSDRQPHSCNCVEFPLWYLICTRANI